MFWLVSLLMSGGAGNGVVILVWIGVCFVSILVHELGHSLAMARFGQSSHIVLYGMGGLAVPDGGGWARARMYGGPRRFSPWVEQVIISAAGPGAGFLLAASTLVFIAVTGGKVMFRIPSLDNISFVRVAVANDLARIIVADLLYINIFWGLVNLLPVYPLDGGQIARAILTARDPWQGNVDTLKLGVFVGGAVAIGAFFLLRQHFLAIMFGWLAASNYMALQNGGYR